MPIDKLPMVLKCQKQLLLSKILSHHCIPLETSVKNLVFIYHNPPYVQPAL